jgi:hypothetical protein
MPQADAHRFTIAFAIAVLSLQRRCVPYGPGFTILMENAVRYGRRGHLAVRCTAPGRLHLDFAMTARRVAPVFAGNV